MTRTRAAVGALAAAVASLSVGASEAAPARGPLVPKDPAAAPCTHPTTTITGQVTLETACIYQEPFTIQASDTTLDCNGAQIVLADGYGVTVKGQISNVTVQNCYVVGGLGVAVRPPKRLEGESDEALRQRSPSAVVLRNLHVSDSTNVGVYVHHHVVGATLADSIVADNSSAGVYLSPYGRGSVIRNNLIQNNGHTKPDGLPRVGWWRREGVAIDGSSEHLVEGNDFDGNAFGGVFLYKNCWEHAASDPNSTPRTEHAHSNVIRGNRFTNMPFGVWIASRQSMDLESMECGDPTPHANPIVLLGFFDSSYSAHPSAYASMYLPWISVWPDFAERNTIEDNLFESIDLGAVRVEDDETIVRRNLFIGDFEYVFVGAPFRARLDGHPVLDTIIAQNSFDSPTSTQFEDQLALIANQHEGTELSENYRACMTPWGGWLRHGESVVAFRPDGTQPGGCAEQIRVCTDGLLDGSFTDEICNPAQAVDAGTDPSDAGAAADAGGLPLDGSVPSEEDAGPAGTGGAAPHAAPGRVDSTEAGCELRPLRSTRGSLIVLVGVVAAAALRRPRRCRADSLRISTTGGKSMKLLSLTTTLTLAGALTGQLSTGCVLETQEVASDALMATESTPIVRCNDGALVVQPDPSSAWEYLAIVYDPGVVDWFVAQSEQLEEVPVVGESNASRTTVQKEFPWMVTIVEDDDGRRLVLRDLRRYDDVGGTRYVTSGPPGSSVEPIGDGMRLSINGSEMIGSHAIAYYNVGEWLFEHCE